MPKFPQIKWSADAWRDTELTEMEKILTPEMVDALATREPVFDGWKRTLPFSRAGAARRHKQRVSDIQVWTGDVYTELDGQADTSNNHHRFFRALRAWAKSGPGDIRAQWIHLPVGIHLFLTFICEVLGCRGGSSRYGPTAGAVEQVMSEFVSPEHDLDLAIRDDDWSRVRYVLADRDLAGWTYGNGVALPPKSTVTFA